MVAKAAHLITYHILGNDNYPYGIYKIRGPKRTLKANNSYLY